MRIVNIIFDDFTQLKNELEVNQVINGSKEKYFVQIFMGITDEAVAKAIVDFFNKELECEVLLTQSGKENIANTGVIFSKVLINISCFKHSSVKSTYCSSSLEEYEVSQKIKTIVSPKTKLLILFIACGSFYNKNILDAIKKDIPNVIVCGGRSHPYANLVGLVGDKDGIYTEGLVCASIDSDVLYVQNNFIFGWESIGLSMTITKSNGNIVQEIDHKKALDVYKKYFGDSILKSLVATNYILPLVHYEGNIPLARVVIDILEDDSLVFNDAIPQGAKVKFAFGLLENIQKETLEVRKLIPSNTQGIYFYSCVSRVMFLGEENLSTLFNTFKDIPSAGFFTYGEVYCSKEKNMFLGLTNTFVSLVEEEPTFLGDIPYNATKVEFGSKSLTVNAISRLMQTINQDVLQLANKFEAYQQLVDETMFHILTDDKLNIIYTNKNISDISLYTQEELIGRNCLDLLDPQMQEYLQKDVLPILYEKKEWVGKVRQLKKDKTPYYVKLVIKAILNEAGKVTNYIIGELDDTADELERIALENDSNLLKHSNEERQYLLQQYDDIIDNNQSLFRLDLNRNFTYVNDIFLEITGLHAEEIIGKNLYNFIPESDKWQFEKIQHELIQQGKYQGILEYTRPDNKKAYIRSACYFIKNLNEEPIEIMAVGVDITKLIESIKEIETIQRDVIYAMGTICEGKSRETGNHIIRVAEYSALLAKLYGCSKEEQELLKTASPMHDIGKVGISDTILNKPGKLTPEEFEIMKTHTTIGQEIFKNSSRLILKTAGEIAGTHHEWWDGSGYPNKLSGEEIPLFGRITAIADVFDALSNDRCYKKAWPLPDVLQHIKSLRGKQFQPELVDLFLDNIDQFLKISREYQDKI
ncbi:MULTISPECIES: HD domain-containing phosphohydrolase [unclassified Helicobacter]|uniref:HD domain-containing phosphohydrolase n=1 Tax=unclassified Helicobacter TaxID=2593540 RepID=UPI000CF0818C|nr:MULTISPECIES: HD domain-containing phosphohydrolase [unclassified Helicobacter]